MEQHPVPQNVTTFQFRLIGDMTIKQFGYLAGGAILAFISYKLPLPFFFTWPLTVIFALGGFGFAFVPIEERPMDVWVLSFLKNVYSPTIFHWEKAHPTVEPITTPPPQAAPQAQQLPSVLSPAAAHIQSPSVSQPPATKHPSPVDAIFGWIDALVTPKPTQSPALRTQFPAQISVKPLIPTPPAKTVTQQTAVLKEHVDMPKKDIREEKEKEDELAELKLQLDTLQNELKTKSTMETRFLDLQKQMTDLMAQRQRMEKELISLKQKEGAATPSAPAPTKQAGVILTRTGNEPTVKVMGGEAAMRAGLPRLTTFPNVVTGIIKDFDNNLLPGVLVTVKDKEGIPLRALKTNKLGQFAASTQLPNGTYVVEVEDPRQRFTFDRMQITLNGSVLPAVQVVAKSKRQMDREQLQKQIFGTPNANT